MQRWPLLLTAWSAATLVACSGRFDDVLSAGDSGDPPVTVIAEASVLEASPVEASTDDASSVEASLVDAVDAPPAVDASLQDASVVDALVESAPLVEASAVDAPAMQDALAPADASTPFDAGYGCYLEGHVYCPIDTWCPLGTCPDGITLYGCTCNADGTTTCSLDCPT